jgi:hypothetical protein
MKKAVCLLEEVEPYEHRDNPLWRLHLLDAKDKHEVILVVCCAIKDTRLTIAPGVTFVQCSPPIYPVENGTILLRLVPTLSEVDMDPEFPPSIAFGQGEIVEGQAIIPTLTEFAGKVDSVVETFLRAGLIA